MPWHVELWGPAYQNYFNDLFLHTQTINFSRVSVEPILCQGMKNSGIKVGYLKNKSPKAHSLNFTLKVSQVRELKYLTN